jgi:hypothetical protein
LGVQHGLPAAGGRHAVFSGTASQQAKQYAQACTVAQGGRKCGQVVFGVVGVVFASPPYGVVGNDRQGGGFGVISPRKESGGQVGGFMVGGFDGQLFGQSAQRGLAGVQVYPRSGGPVYD